jgi:uncharacterized protein YfaT (DUF1175 family)
VRLALSLLSAGLALSPAPPPLALSPAGREQLVRQGIAEVAVAQLERLDPRWEPSQRDCAGLVRFAYRAAFHKLWPDRASQPLWRSASGAPAEFADAQTLLAGSFRLLGRDDRARAALRSGDLVAFRQEPGRGLETDGEAQYHLMLVVVPPGAPPSRALVVYHPGEPGAALRSGALASLAAEAPLEWRPLPESASFLGFYRFQEWTR